MKQTNTPTRKQSNINNILIVVISIMIVVFTVIVILVVHVKLKDQKPISKTPSTVRVFENNTTSPTFPPADSSSQVNSNNESTNRQQSVGQQPVVTTAATRDPSTWSTSEVLQEATNAINKTKAYSGQVSVHHTESFNANITNITGGNLVKQFANSLVSKVIKPKDETLSFSGGYATDSDGESLSILLPDGKNFSLSINGISSASSYKSNTDTVINLNLVTEYADITSVPPYNAASVGYLNVADFDLSIITVTKCSIEYVGTTIGLVVNSDGYVKEANYKMPMHIDGEGTGMGINGVAQFDGYQAESWVFNW